VQLSVKYETVLNMTTAKALGLDVPTSILLSADERNTATQEDWIADGGNGSWSFSNSGPRIKLSVNILAGSRVLSAVGACPLHDGVR
jgi:hypothetical protein